MGAAAVDNPIRARASRCERRRFLLRLFNPILEILANQVFSISIMQSNNRCTIPTVGLNPMSDYADNPGTLVLLTNPVNQELIITLFCSS